MDRRLTGSYFKLLGAIERHHAEHGEAPTVRQLVAATGSTMESTQDRIGMLSTLGLISRRATLQPRPALTDAGRKLLEQRMVSA